MCRECGLLRGAGNHRRSRSEGTYQGCRARPSLELPDETPPPTPSPQRRGGASQTRLFFSPSPCRGGGWGEGFRPPTLRAQQHPGTEKPKSGRSVVSAAAVRIWLSLCLLSLVVADSYSPATCSEDAAVATAEGRGWFASFCEDDLPAVAAKSRDSFSSTMANHSLQ